MNIHKSFAYNLQKWGRKITVLDRSDAAVQTKKCFMQALRYKNKMYMEGTPTDIGISNSGYFLLLAPPDFAVNEVENGGCISDGEKKYHIDRWEKIYAGEEVFYIWAIIKEDTKGCYPDYDHFRRRGE